MDHPPVEMGPSERILSVSEIAELVMRGIALFPRQFAVEHKASISDSERVTYDDTYGYIFRYDLVDFIEGDGTWHPESGIKFDTVKIETKLIAHTKDGKKWQAATIPLLEF